MFPGSPNATAKHWGDGVRFHDKPCWDRATQIALAFDRKGTPIPPQDSLIAAHALQVGAAVLSFDLHFQQVTGLITLTTLD